MRYQSHRAACGAAALHNALQALGISRSEEELGGLAGTTADGTSSRGMIKAIKAIGTDHELIGKNMRWKDIESAQVGLWFLVANKGRPVILCTEDFGHWVACVGYTGGRFIVVDSDDPALVLFYTKEELEPVWVGPNGGYHGIVL